MTWQIYIRKNNIESRIISLKQFSSLAWVIGLRFKVDQQKLLLQTYSKITRNKNLEIIAGFRFSEDFFGKGFGESQFQKSFLNFRKITKFDHLENCFMTTARCECVIIDQLVYIYGERFGKQNQKIFDLTSAF